jgi:hypothetical protein
MFRRKIGQVVVGVLALALALSSSAAAQAGGKKGGKGPVVKFSLYKGYHHVHHHHHWAFTRYYVDYGCILYYDPDTQTFYYWCPPDNCFYPVSYCPYDKYSWAE